ncbi:MAG TPA: twin-arginine translocation signal domain-containing protein [Anaerolineae bacterium]|nr:twin-arginine translocation signal domain-containing protein [Anaerolineae bacterium]
MALQVTRRDFLKLSALAGAGLILFTPVSASPPPGRPPEGATTGVEWRPNICTMCSNTCGIRVAVKQVGGIERAVKIEGNPHHPYNKGRLCARGQSGIRRTYSSDRIKTPLIRVEGSKRGEWAFRKASWDEAYDYIVSKIKEKNIQPYEMGLAGGWITCAFYRPFIVSFALATGIPNILGTPMQHCVTGEHFGISSMTGNFNIHAECMADYANAKYILALRSNASISGVSTGRAVRFAEALNKGAKVVVVDPRLSELGAKATQWLPIKPGTDMALILALLREVMKDGNYNAEFLTHYTNAVFLAFEKDGVLQLAMEMDEATGQPAAFYAYDEQSGEIRRLPGVTNDNMTDSDGNTIQPALVAPDGLTWHDRRVKTVFQWLRERVEPYTAEWAAPITDLPVEAIQQILHDFTTIKPAILEPGWYDSRYENTPMLRKAMAMVMAITGSIAKQGGWVCAGVYREEVEEFWETIWSGESPSAAPGIMGPVFMLKRFFENPDFWPHGHPSISKAWDEQQQEQGKDGVAFRLFGDVGWYDAAAGKLTYKGEPYRLRAIFAIAANLARSFGDDKTVKHMLENLDLVVGVDILPTDTMRYADVILPDLTYLEKGDFISYVEMVPDVALAARYPVATAPGVDARHVIQIFLELAEHMGMGEQYMQACCNFMGWNPDHFQQAVLDVARQKGEQIGIALRDCTIGRLANQVGKPVDEVAAVFREQGVYTLQTAEEAFEEMESSHQYPVPTPSGRFEIYNMMMANFIQQYGPKPNWDPLIAYIPPQWKEGMKETDSLPDDEFFYAHGKIPQMSYTAANDNDLLMAIVEQRSAERFGVWINPERATKLGINTGDRIRLTNTIAPDLEVEGTAYVTEKIRPDTLFIVSNFGAESEELRTGNGKGIATNKLTPYRLEPLVGGFRANEFTVRVSKV